MVQHFKPVEPNARTLGGIVLFAALPEARRAALARECRAGMFPAGAEVVAHQDLTRDVYFVVSGTARAMLYAPSGRLVTFRDIEAGQAFGDLAAIDGGPRSATVVTRVDALLVWLSASRFEALIESEPVVARALIGELIGQVRRLSDRVVEFSTLAARNRLHAELLRLARERVGADEGDAAVVTPAPTHADLASRISSHREAVSREMHRLAGAGLIERRDRSLLIHDLARFEDMVEEAQGVAET